MKLRFERRNGLYRPLALRELFRTKARSSIWDDMRELSAMDMLANGPWKRQMHELLIDGIPVNIAGGLAGLEVNPSSVNHATVTIGTATELAAWTPQTYTPVSAFTNAPKVYSLKAFGTVTSAATPGTQTMNPRVDVVGGTSMGISGAITPTASETASPWYLDGTMVLRKAGDSAATMVGVFNYVQSSVVGGGGQPAASGSQVFGGTSVTWDNTAVKGLWMGMLAVTSTTNTIIPQAVIWGSWN